VDGPRPSGSWPTLDSTTVEGRELIAPLSKTLSLPSSCAFEPLLPRRFDAPLSESAQSTFDSHATFRLPCDHQCAASRGRRVLGMCDVVHTFTLRLSVSAPLNEQLGAWALHREQLAKAGTAAAVGKGEEFSVHKSNWGGYQSYEDVFEQRHDEPAIFERMACCRMLHRVATAAINEIEPSAASAVYAVADEAAACAAYAWVNVNRPADLNFLHVHDAGKWSGVYFVSRGAPPAAEAPPTAGHLVFRGGMQKEREGRAAEEATSHTYMAVPPTPGTFWLFPGMVPHCVFPVAPGEGQAESRRGGERSSAEAGDSAARISIAINFQANTPPSVST